MAQARQPNDKDIDNVKKALVSAGVLKSATLAEADRAKLTQELSKHGVEAPAIGAHIICNFNYCIIVRGDRFITES